MTKVLIHIVTYNSEKTIAAALTAVLKQSGVPFSVRVTDNASKDGTREVLKRFESNIALTLNSENFGFSAGQNLAVHTFLNSPEYSHLLVHNPDLAPKTNLLSELLQALTRHPDAGIATPKLLRADEQLAAITPPTLDAAGMRLTTELRHFDIGSGKIDAGQYEREGYVFGGSGACLLLTRAAVEKLLLPRLSQDSKLTCVYPQISDDELSRAPLFDEGFFAYREDAELAWRAQRFGIRCIYAPKAIGFHQRVVLPERRAALPKQLNLLGVQNRFLLQLNHLELASYSRAILPGFLFRNLAVIAGVLLKEHSSLPAFGRIFKLLPRALALRRYFRSHASKQNGKVSRWLTQEIEYD